MKVMISSRGKICIAFADPSMAGFTCTHKTITDDSGRSNLQMDLNFIAVGKGHMKHFTAQDEALLIGDKIYIKGPTNQMLMILIG